MKEACRRLEASSSVLPAGLPGSILEHFIMLVTII